MSKIEVDEIYNSTGDSDSGVDMSTNDVVAVKIAGAEKARWDASGNLLVGTTATGSGALGFRWRSDLSAISSVADGGIAGYFGRRSSDGEILKFRKDDADVGVIGSLSGIDLFIAGNRGAGLRLTDQEFFPVNASGATNDNAIDLGHSVGRFDDIYATNSTINTSDENEKQNIASFTTKELAVATKLSALFKTFKWKDKVTEKADKARTHSGIVAQQVKTTFASEGLDATNYGLFISTTWKDDDGKEQIRMGVRYPELFSFIFGSIEARLTALEAK